jgi:hypothetical protein
MPEMLYTEEYICQPNTTTDGSVSLNLADIPSELASSSLLTLTNLDTGAQRTIDFLHFSNCFSLVGGNYRVAFHTPGHEPFLGRLTVTPGEQASVRPSITKVDTPTPTLQTILTNLQVPNPRLIRATLTSPSAQQSSWTAGTSPTIGIGRRSA